MDNSKYMFILGFISGIIFCIFIVIIEIWLNGELTKVKNKVKRKFNKSAIITISNQKEKTIREKIKLNNKKGIDTPIEELYEN